MPIEAILFDLDGTLIDSAEDFIQVLNEQRADHKLSPLPDHVIRNTVSDGARALTKLAFGGEPGEAHFEAHRQDLLGRYQTQVGEHAQLFEGMLEVIEQCERLKIHWGIITNKPRLYTDIMLERLELASRSSITLCPDDVSKSKPDPESLLLAAENLKLECANTVYVGDHERDILAGNAAGMITVAAQYGYIKDPKETENWCANYQIAQPIELISLFLT